MKFNKLLIISMLVMMICCVSAVSATDINATDDSTVDEVSEVIEEVEIDDVSDDVVEEQNLVTASADTGKVNGVDYSNYFDTTSGALTNTAATTLTFTGNFNEKTFQNFVINRAVTINANGATFNNLGFDLTSSGITFNGATIIMDAPNGSNCYAIDIENANNVNVINNKITYTCGSANADYYNYVIKVMNSENVTIDNNTITASLPLKDVDYSSYPEGFPGISYDHVAGVAVENAEKFKFTNNVLNVTGHVRGGYFPTLDALLVIKSPNSLIEGNKIYEQDDVTAAEETNYLYAVDIYQCNNLTIRSNKIELNSGSGNLTVNGTGGAYGIQLTGGHSGIVIAYNNITTANNGPNLGIYSQNYEDDTYLTIYGNRINVTGRAGDNPWALVSGMELQDTNVSVYDNTVYVNNIGGDSSQCAYGISYSQETYSDHYFYISGNTVIVENGEYAVYLADFNYAEVINNGLRTTLRCGDNATELGGINYICSGNYCP